ncbi:MAG: histidine--tRNA ligase [Gammaproteobacteria bacterium]|nr:histidine--tRNA ligase [Gammaproteobacteria bacterium]
MSRLQAIRGMNDILPDQSPLWRHIEDAFRATAEAFGYREIRFPLLEQTRLFRRSIGEVTDIVEKEMYSFADSGGDDISLRPEGTAGCVRAARQHGLLHNRQQRLWYQGPMFRRERPQKGRYRQFHQFGVEAFGMAGPDIDAEIIELSQALWRRLGLGGALTLELNNIGSAEDRKRYSAVLSEYLAVRAEEIDPAARARIHSNPLRVLDSKHPGTREVAQEAPVLASHLSPESIAHYAALKGLLKAAGIRHVENPALVRGLDYYNYCVFEWTTDALGAQGAVCGGGRYDGLVAQLGGRPSPAAGFAIGVERLALLLETLGKIPAKARYRADICIVAVGDGITAAAQALARDLRERHPALSVVCQCGGGKYAQQVKRAFELNTRLVVVLEQPPDGPPREVRLRKLEDGFQPVTATLEDCPKEVFRLLNETEGML